VLEPVAVALKFGFLAVLYLFLLWVARSALRDLTRARESTVIGRAGGAAAVPAAPAAGRQVKAGLVVERGRGLRPGTVYDVGRGILIGRGGDADVVLEDNFASQRHARVESRDSGLVLVDLDSTNGTYLNGRQVKGETELRIGDRIRIGETELRLAD
jgi:hypothetical protein